MADKVQKIREEVERLQKELIQEKEKGFGSDIDDACILELQNVLTYIDSLKEEPKFKTGDRIKPVDSCLGAPRTILEVCDGWYVTNQGTLDFEFEDNWEAVEEPVSEDLEKTAKDYSNNLDNIYGSIGEQTRNAFKAGANWQKAKDESTTEDLGKYINKLSKQFPEVSFAKLSRIAVRAAKWQKQQDQSTIELAEDHAYFSGRTKTIGEINEALLSEVLPCFMHGGEADEVVAKLDEVLNQKK